MEVVSDGCAGASTRRPGVAGPYVVTRSPVEGAARGPSPVLGGDCSRRLERGCGWGGWGVRARRLEMVPARWRNAAHLAGPGIGALSVVCSNGKRSRSCAPSGPGCVRSPADWVVPPRRSRGSFGAMPPRARIAWSTGQRPHTGTPSGAPAAPRSGKLAANDVLRQYVNDRLAGVIARPDGERVEGPDVRWIGRRHGRRADRRWATSWSSGADLTPLGGRFPR